MLVYASSEDDGYPLRLSLMKPTNSVN